MIKPIKIYRDTGVLERKDKRKILTPCKREPALMRSIQRERISRFLVRRSRYEYWRAFSTLSRAILIQFLALPLNPFANLNTSFLFIFLSRTLSLSLSLAEAERLVKKRETGFWGGLCRFKLLFSEARRYSRPSYFSKIPPCIERIIIRINYFFS